MKENRTSSWRQGGRSTKLLSQVLQVLTVCKGPGADERMHSHGSFPWAVYNTGTRGLLWPSLTKGKPKKNKVLWGPEEGGINFDRTGVWKRKRSCEEGLGWILKEKMSWGWILRVKKTLLGEGGIQAQRSGGWVPDAFAHALRGELLLPNHYMLTRYLFCAMWYIWE